MEIMTQLDGVNVERPRKGMENRWVLRKEGGDGGLLEKREGSIHSKGY